MNTKTTSQSIKANYLISVEDAARLLGIHRRTLEREVCRKHLPPPLKIGAKSLYAVSDVESYVRKLMERRNTMA